MSDIKLFRVNGKATIELASSSVALERSLQKVIETHLETFLGVRFLSTEHPTGKTHAGRIDTLGIDENGCPVIIEYKRSTNQNVINQGLFYLDWLMDHRGEFKLLVMERLGKKVASSIEWSSPRLLCIAGDFTRYDEHAVMHMQHNIELIRYRRYGDELLLFELVNAVIAEQSGLPGKKQRNRTRGAKSAQATALNPPIPDLLANATVFLRDLYENLKTYLISLGDDVQVRHLKLYIAFRRLKNFAGVEVRAKINTLLVYVKVDPDTVELKPGFTRSVRAVGHWAPGDLEIALRTMDDLERAKPLLLKSYESS